LLLPIAVASASSHVETVVSFDPAQGQFPEGIAADARGNLYVSLAPLGQIWKIEPDGEMTLFAGLVDPVTVPLALGALGLAIDRPGNIYVALASFDPATHGVWRISRDGTTRERLAGSEAIVLPNALAFDHQHNLYVTDSLLGAVWRIPRSGTAELWLQDELLVGIPDLMPGGTPIGANGIAYHHDTLLVTNTTTRTLLRIPIARDGSAGKTEFVRSFSQFLDGITVDERGNLYLPLLTADEQHTIVRLTQSGELTTLATAADGLDFPVSLTFGKSHDTHHTLFITNFAVFPSANPARPGPGVVKVEVGPAKGGIWTAAHERDWSDVLN
jgi:sugar lactone lactonase YvrE